jgi:hypothetical protein
MRVLLLLLRRTVARLKPNGRGRVRYFVLGPQNSPILGLGVRIPMPEESSAPRENLWVRLPLNGNGDANKTETTDSTVRARLDRK